MIADLKAYPEYKSSHDWLGPLPLHWSQMRAKYLFREVDQRSASGSEELLSVSHLTGVTPRSEKTVTMFLAESNVGHKICQPADVVINTMWAWMGALGVARHTGIVSPSYGVYRPLANSKILPRYVDHLLRSPAYVAEYRRRSTGVNSSRLRLYPEHFLRIPIVIPPVAEQIAIVRFLNHMTGRVERAIRAKRKVIALLNEQKRLIIHHAITRGLDPSVSLKPSGIPWLNDIPRHWEVSRVKNEFHCLNARRVPLDAAERGEMTLKTYDYYGASGVIDKVDDFLFDDELLLIAEDGANLVLRNLPLAIIAKGKFWVNNHAHILKPKRGSITYLAHLLETLNYEPWISGAAQPKLTKDRLLSISIAVAPPNEQDQIVQRTSEQTRPLIAAISQQGREIALLREYRTRLVADVVTGRLDVREVAAHPLEEPPPEADVSDDPDALDVAELADEEAVA